MADRQSDRNNALLISVYTSIYKVAVFIDQALRYSDSSSKAYLVSQYCYN